MKPKKKCIILLPLTYNDKTEVPPSVLTGILREIDDRFDGHYVSGVGDGAYRMSDGTMAYDTCASVWIAVDPARVEELRKLAGKIARILKQESVWFEITGSDVDFEPPSPTDGGES